MKFSVHVTLVDGSMKRFEIDAGDRITAGMAAVAQLPAMCVESVNAWPIRPQVEVVLDALQLRVGPSPVYDSAFGCLA